MGLFDMLGAGGGALSIQVQPSTVQAGTAVTGTVTFTGGKRVQQINALKIRLSARQRLGAGASKLQWPEATIATAFAAQPGQTYTHAFSFPVPADAPSSAPDFGYALTASAEIDREVDPGASATVIVVNPAPTATVPGMVDMASVPPLFSPSKDGPIPAGTRCEAQYRDGNFYPGIIGAAHGDVYEVQWDAGSTSMVHAGRLKAKK